MQIGPGHGFCVGGPILLPAFEQPVRQAEADVGAGVGDGIVNRQLAGLAQNGIAEPGGPGGFQFATQLWVGIDDGVGRAFAEPEFVEPGQQGQSHRLGAGFEGFAQLQVEPVVEGPKVPADAKADVAHQAAVGALQGKVAQHFAQAFPVAFAGQHPVEDAYRGQARVRRCQWNHPAVRLS